MALWQYSFHITPQVVLEESGINQLLEQHEDGADTSVFLVGMSTNKTLFSKITEVLPVGKSWCNNIDL